MRTRPAYSSSPVYCDSYRVCPAQGSPSQNTHAAIGTARTAHRAVPVRPDACGCARRRRSRECAVRRRRRAAEAGTKARAKRGEGEGRGQGGARRWERSQWVAPPITEPLFGKVKCQLFHTCFLTRQLGGVHTTSGIWSCGYTGRGLQPQTENTFKPPVICITPANAKRQAGGSRGSGSNLHRNELSECTSSQQRASYLP